MLQKDLGEFFYDSTFDASSWYSITSNLMQGKFYRGVIFTAAIATLIKHKNSPVKIIVDKNKLLAFLSYLASNKITDRFQIMFYFEIDSHPVGLDLFYDSQMNKLNIFCFESSALITQYNALQMITSHCDHHQINYQVLACQAFIQKDAYNCSLFIFLALQKVSKTKIFDVLLEQNKFLNNQPTFVISPYKQEARPLLKNVFWVMVTAMPLKIILMDESFSEMEMYLPNKTNEILAFKEKFNLTTQNTYIWHKRVQYGRELIAKGNTFFNFENTFENNEKYKDISINKETTFYFNEIHGAKVIAYLNKFVEELQLQFKLFTRMSEWIISEAEESRLMVRLVFNPLVMCVIIHLCDFLKKLNIEFKIDHESELTLFFPRKNVEIAFYQDFMPKNPSLYQVFEDTVFPKKQSSQIAQTMKHYLNNKQHIFILKILECALEKGYVDYFTQLLSLLAQNTMVKFENNNSWLHLTVLINAKKTFKFLLDNGINLTAENSDKKTAIDEIISLNNVDFLKIVIEKNLLNQRNSENNLPIQYTQFERLKYEESRFSSFKLIFANTAISQELLLEFIKIGVQCDDNHLLEFLVAHKNILQSDKENMYVQKF